MHNKLFSVSKPDFHKKYVILELCRVSLISAVCFLSKELALIALLKVIGSQIIINNSLVNFYISKILDKFRHSKN